MRIDFTVAQVEALDSELYSEDDNLRDFPIPEIHELAVIREDPQDEDSTILGYAGAHPDLTWEDEEIIKLILDERAAELQAIRDADRDDRAGMRKEIRQRIRQDARKAARQAERQADRQAARVTMRRELRQEPRIAARIAARRSEIEAEQELNNV
jgi:hypothetical protein